MYLSAVDSKLRKTFFFFLVPLVIFCGFLISKQLEVSYFETTFLGVEKFFLKKSNYLNLVPFLDGSILGNILYLTLGTGLGVSHEIAERYAGYGIYGLEIRLITVLLFRYGLIYLFILGYLAFQVFRIKNSDKTIVFYKAILLQFIVSLVHYCEMFTIGVFEVFIVTHAVFVSFIIHSNRVKYVKVPYSLQRVSDQ